MTLTALPPLTPEQVKQGINHPYRYDQKTGLYHFMQDGISCTAMMISRYCGKYREKNAQIARMTGQVNVVDTILFDNFNSHQKASYEFDSILVMETAQGARIDTKNVKNDDLLRKQLLHDTLVWTILGNDDAVAHNAVYNKTQGIVWYDTEHGLAPTGGCNIYDAMNEFFFNREARGSDSYFSDVTLNELQQQTKLICGSLKDKSQELNENSHDIAVFWPNVLDRAAKLGLFLDQLVRK